LAPRAGGRDDIGVMVVAFFERCGGSQQRVLEGVNVG
jgi:hypothetical protein